MKSILRLWIMKGSKTSLRYPVKMSLGDYSSKDHHSTTTTLSDVECVESRGVSRPFRRPGVDGKVKEGRKISTDDCLLGTYRD